MAKKFNLNSILLTILIVLVCVFYNDYKTNLEESTHKIYKSYSGDTSTTSNSGIAYMVETGANTGIYEQASDSTWPNSEDIFYNSTKSACEKGSTLSYDSTNHKITINSTKTDKCYVYFQKGIPFYSKILTDNGGATAISAKGTPNFGVVSTTNDGMYAAADDYGTSYYFRGAVDNNWVKFAGIYWRIIRINGDNTVRMIYSGTTAPTSSTATVMTGTGIQIRTSTFNNNYDNMFVGYMYTSGQVHGYGTSSTIKSTIDTWYNSNLASYANKIADSVYCNDRSPSTSSSSMNGSGGTGTTETYYGAYNRLVTNKTPQLSCPTQSDAFTVSDTTKGNAHLTNPIGLITADEVSMAGGLWNRNNSSYYLYNDSYYWTASPYGFTLDSNSYANLATMFRNGPALYQDLANYTCGSRPVISLKSTISTAGSGTYSDPYLVNS